jgi:hypothetical protein
MYISTTTGVYESLMYKPREGCFLTNINTEPSARERHDVLPSSFRASGVLHGHQSLVDIQSTTTFNLAQWPPPPPPCLAILGSAMP